MKKFTEFLKESAISVTMKRSINAALVKNGFDGSVPFSSFPGAITRLADTLKKYGLELFDKDWVPARRHDTGFYFIDKSSQKFNLGVFHHSSDTNIDKIHNSALTIKAKKDQHHLWIITAKLD